MTDEPTRHEIEDAAGRLHTTLSGLAHLREDLSEYGPNRGLSPGMRDALIAMIELANRQGVEFIAMAEKAADRLE